MSGVRRSLAEHPIVVIFGVLAAVIGVLAGIKDLAASDPAPPSASGPASATPSPTEWPSSDPAETPVPSEPVAQSLDEEPPAPDPAPDPATSAAEDSAPDDSKAETPQHTEALTVRIKMGSSGKVGPDTFRAGARPGADTEVYDDTGQLDRKCYVKWTLKRGSEVVRRVTSERCRPPSITLFNFEDSLDEPGSYTLTADVTTDWHQTGNETVSFDVVSG